MFSLICRKKWSRSQEGISPTVSKSRGASKERIQIYAHWLPFTRDEPLERRVKEGKKLIRKLR